ncbi:MAG: FAD-dependent cmnm(5)s(2)U34 oxidoreductase [Moraxellaceae bacterium]|jgi:tRNA 5-methylaminomethyl-2-thiouridine biosynthesis bifunctional protein|nr:FAD-dependent cmnm(5)s(2)U34 oxidoreductase [Moraxellaceae bacterium]
MTDTLRPASLDWSQGIPFAREFGDVYFSRAGGLAETTHVFLQQNALAARFARTGAADNFTLVETGFGTGRNCLATVDLWRRSGATGWLHYTSIEKHPIALDDLARAQACWPELAELARELQRQYPPLVAGFHRICFPAWRVTLTLCFGDVADCLPRLCARVDAWFLDGFAPARNPGMWNEALYRGMAECSTAGTTFATYTAAGQVRHGLVAAGFAVEKVPGFSNKRDMLRGHFTATGAPPRHPRPWLQRPSFPAPAREACVIGAGIAGAQTAHRLALRGWRVTVLEAERVAGAGSGNPAAVVYGRLAARGKALDHFPQQAWLFALRELAGLPREDSPWHPCGILQLAARNEPDSTTIPDEACWPPELARVVSAAEASTLAGVEIDRTALFHAGAGWLEAERHCRQLLAYPGINLREQTPVHRIERGDGCWRLLDAQGEILQESAVVIVATAGAARQFPVLATLPVNTVRGQVSLAPASSLSAGLRTVVCEEGYISPALPGRGHCLGATFQPGSSDTSVHLEDHAANRAQLAAALPRIAASLPGETTWTGRAALRCQTPDYLPMAGPVAERGIFMDSYAGLRDGKVMAYPDLPVLPGLYVNIGHGSKGFSQAALVAEILAAELNGEPAPVSAAVLESLHPMRFWARELRRGKVAGC